MSQAERFDAKVEAAFDSWLKARDIKVALFDLDSTLVKTNEVFITQIEEFLSFCKNAHPEIDNSKFIIDFDEIHSSVYKNRGVAPSVWIEIVNNLCERYETDKFVAGLPLLDQIYLIPPPMFDGVKETLDVFRKSKVRMGLVTHASKAYTDLKLDAHNLGQYFEVIMAINPDEHLHKEDKHWSAAIKTFGVSVENTIAIGDSLGSDINPAAKVGIQNLIWIQSKWKLQNEGVVPEGTIKINSIGELIPSLIGGV